MIPKEIRQNPELALTDSRFEKPEWIHEFLYGYWTFGLPDETLRQSGDVGVRLAEKHGLSLQAQAHKRRGTAYRRFDPQIAKESLESALAIYQQLPPDQKGLADAHRRLGIIEEELRNWKRSDIEHHTAVVMLEKQERHYKGVALASWGASKLTRAFLEGKKHLFIEAAKILSKSVKKLQKQPKEPMLGALTNLVTALMMAEFPEDTLEETFLSLQEARSAASTQRRGPIRTKLTLGIRIHRVKHEEIDLRICWAECYLIIRQKRFEDAAIGLRRIRRGFEALKMHHAVCEIALDEAFCLALLGRWKQARKITRISANDSSFDVRAKELLHATEKEDVDLLVRSFKSLTKSGSRIKNPVVVAAGFDLNT